MGKLRSSFALTCKRAQGVTLIELMIVVVVLGILAAIAYPSYTEFVARAKRNEAKAALLQIATNQEKLYLQNSTFTMDLTDLGFATTPIAKTDSEAYDITVVAADPSNFTATATFLLGGAEDGRCRIFTIDGRGAKTSFPNTDCWTSTR